MSKVKSKKAQTKNGFIHWLDPAKSGPLIACAPQNPSWVNRKLSKLQLSKRSKHHQSINIGPSRAFVQHIRALLELQLALLSAGIGM